MGAAIGFVGADGYGRTVSTTDPLPVDIGTATLSVTADGVEIKNDAGNPIPTIQGLEIPAHDNIQLTYTGENLTGVAYRVGGTTVATLTLAYTGTRLDSVTKS
jgi:hypothetical protein